MKKLVYPGYVFDEVDCRENDNPDDVDKVPRQASYLDIDSALMGIHCTRVGIEVEAQYPEDSNRNVDTVRTSHHIES